MKKKILKEIIQKKENKIEFAVITNLENGKSCIFEKNKTLDKDFKKYEDQIISSFSKKENGIIKDTKIFEGFGQG